MAKIIPKILTGDYAKFWKADELARTAILIKGDKVDGIKPLYRVSRYMGEVLQPNEWDF